MARVVSLLETYYPNIMKQVREFQKIAEAEDPELNTAWQCAEDVFSDEFIESLTANGCKRWESILKLHPLSSDSLEVRRKRILVKINTVIPYTHRSYQNILNAIYGEDKAKISLNYNNYEFWLDLAAAILPKSAELRNLSREIIPANLTINVSNTQTAKLNLYAGAAIQRYKHTTVKPMQNFTVENSPVANYAFGGGVKRMVHITIRS